ncbi:hypothetical protein BH23VER1_BH23VER1_22080 [soil metagenome]
MKIGELALASIEACEAEGLEYMLTGAFATSCYGIPRSTKDVDLVLALPHAESLPALMSRLDGLVEFSGQVQFDTLTWGKRMVGVTRQAPSLQVEFFELFDDPFVQSQFARRRPLFVEVLKRDCMIPTAEDVVVQKLRWARDKDLIDATDVVVVQQPANLDLEYMRRWCRVHGSEQRLDEILQRIDSL